MDTVDKTGHSDFTHFPVNEEFDVAKLLVIYSCLAKSSYGAKSIIPIYYDVGLLGSFCHNFYQL